MSKQILRVRLTNNVKQLKKYVDKAILDGAESIEFDMDKENPYFLFYADFTPEENQEYAISKLKEDFNQSLKRLESKKFKTYSFRAKKYISTNDMNKLVDEFLVKNNIYNKTSEPKIKQVITDEYDDFDSNTETIFITEVIEL